MGPTRRGAKERVPDRSGHAMSLCYHRSSANGDPLIQGRMPRVRPLQIDYLWKSVKVGVFPWDRFRSPVQSVGIMRSASVVLPAQNESQHADLAPRRFG
jgi:hypothetical protein